ncbi:hypothetical protein GXW82_41400 [Streptacidiphilus sp. 4-A2]|nr:hypothetical protein [Streptacidiphilus sp. 4-A2]
MLPDLRERSGQCRAQLGRGPVGGQPVQRQHPGVPLTDMPGRGGLGLKPQAVDDGQNHSHVAAVDVHEVLFDQYLGHADDLPRHPTCHPGRLARA